jgi:hypothetical protein
VLPQKPIADPTKATVQSFLKNLRLALEVFSFGMWSIGGTSFHDKKRLRLTPDVGLRQHPLKYLHFAASTDEDKAILVIVIQDPAIDETVANNY